MKNLRLRTKLLAIAVPPLAILAVLVAYALQVTFLDGGAVDGAAMQDDLRVLGVVGLAGVLGSALALVLVTRSVTGPLARLTRAADELSATRLPALVEQLRDPGATPPAPAELLELDSDDELGRLARAIDGVQAVAAEVTAAQQGLVRESLSTLVVNLARRNQAMLERQLSFIDQLETSEQDPDRLEDLYRLDHLATRMRRNAESLLVLAGAEPTRRRGAPVQLVDVVRVAIGEIEDYRHVQLGAIEDVEVGSNVAVDLAHLLSELMENATQFSPPDVAVVVEAGWSDGGGYTVAVVDQGIGMGDEQLAEANELLSSPPELGLDLSRSLGFLVIGRLARRLGVTVSLQPSPERGLTATVRLPADLVLDAEAPAVPAPTPAEAPEPLWPASAPLGPGASEPAAPAAPEPAPAEPAQQAISFDLAHPSLAPAAADDRLADEAQPWWSAPTQAERPEPAGPGLLDELRRVSGPPHLADALPEGEAFDRGISGLLAPPPAHGAPPPVEPPVSPPLPAEVLVPAAPERTDAGLVRRRRGEQAPAEQTGRPVAASSRSPEEIREMLARYRSGIKHRRPTTGTPHDEEATR